MGGRRLVRRVSLVIIAAVAAAAGGRRHARFRILMKSLALIATCGALVVTSAQAASAATRPTIRSGPSGTDPTTTQLTSSSASVPYGEEQYLVFDVTVTAQTSGTPTGTVTISAGSTQLCSLKLEDGSGDCGLSPEVLNSGSYSVVATYAGDSTYAASTSAAVTVTITKPVTITGISLSVPRVVYGREKSLKISVTVGAVNHTPAGTIIVSAGSKKVCTLKPKSGRGHCRLASNTLLAPGTYAVTAAFHGRNFARSTSGAVKLRIARRRRKR